LAVVSVPLSEQAALQEFVAARQGLVLIN